VRHAWEQLMGPTRARGWPAGPTNDGPQMTNLRQWGRQLTTQTSLHGQAWGLAMTPTAKRGGTLACLANGAPTPDECPR